MTYKINEQTKQQLHDIRRGIISKMFNITGSFTRQPNGDYLCVMKHRPLTEKETQNAKLMALLNETLTEGQINLQREFDNAPRMEDLRRALEHVTAPKTDIDDPSELYI